MYEVEGLQISLTSIGTSPHVHPVVYEGLFKHHSCPVNHVLLVLRPDEISDAVERQVFT